MTETENLKFSLEMIQRKKISTSIELLERSKNAYILKVLGILYCIQGNFGKAYSIFFKLKAEEKISEYLFFLEGTIKKDYIPKYNRMIELIQKKQNPEEIKEMIIELEKISPNVELYNVAVLFYLSQGNIRTAYNYYMKLKEMDSSFKNNDKFETFFKNKKLTKKLKLNHSLQVLLLIISAFFITRNLNLKENLISKNRETTNLEKKLEIIKTEKEELIKSQEKNIVVVKEGKLFTNNELYNLALKRFNQGYYREVFKIADKIEVSKLPEYKEKEILFIKAQSYEKLLEKNEALKYYKEFIKKYNKEQYSDYIKISEQKIKKLEKEIL